jgi:hypothetical protein
MATPGRYDTPAGNLSGTPWLRTVGRRYLSVLGAGNVVSLVSAGGSRGEWGSCEPAPDPGRGHLGQRDDAQDHQ